MEGLIQLSLLAVAGFLAQLVDGSLGMGYGITSSTILIFIGLSPAAASASVHIAKIGTGASSGFAHHRFGEGLHSLERSEHLSAQFFFQDFPLRRPDRFQAPSFSS
jgi:uncharacterized membrane protein YfcA